MNRIHHLEEAIATTLSFATLEAELAFARGRTRTAPTGASS